jgi:hypothetical protein
MIPQMAQICADGPGQKSAAICVICGCIFLCLHDPFQNHPQMAQICADGPGRNLRPSASSADASSCVCMTLSRTIHRWRRFAQMAPAEICGHLRHLRMHLVFAIDVSV